MYGLPGLDLYMKVRRLGVRVEAAEQNIGLRDETPRRCRRCSFCAQRSFGVHGWELQPIWGVRVQR